MFAKKKRAATGKRRELEDSAMKWIAKVIQKAQYGWSGWMDRWFNRLPRRVQLIVASVSLLLAIGYCAAMVAGIVSSPLLIGNGRRVVSSPEFITRSNPYQPPSGNDPTLKRIVAFKKYLDSLGSSREGRLKLDSIRCRHPGMMDSLAQVEKMYNQNKKEEE